MVPGIIVDRAPGLLEDELPNVAVDARVPDPTPAPLERPADGPADDPWSRPEAMPQRSANLVMLWLLLPLVGIILYGLLVR